MRGSYSGNTLAFQANAESSILLPRSNFCLVNSVVECFLYTEEVGSSKLSRGTSFRIDDSKNVTANTRIKRWTEITSSLSNMFADTCKTIGKSLSC